MRVSEINYVRTHLWRANRPSFKDECTIHRCVIGAPRKSVINYKHMRMHLGADASLGHAKTCPMWQNLHAIGHPSISAFEQCARAPRSSSDAGSLADEFAKLECISKLGVHPHAHTDKTCACSVATKSN